jgi:hypothetical protein
VPRFAGAATKPYAACWRGAVGILHGHQGVLSVHARPDLAVNSARRSRDAIRGLWGAYQPWFLWSVVDRRSGETIQLIR